MSKFRKPFQDKQEKIIFINARIIDPESGYDKEGSILIDQGKIIDFGKIDIPKNIQVIDCQGDVVCPGLIDIQVHFRDPGQTYKEDLITGSMSAVAGGITTVVCQPNTVPTIDSSFIVDYINFKEKESYCNIKTYASVTKGLKGEELTDMLALANSGVVGFTDDGLPVKNSILMRRAFEYSAQLGLVVAQHAEDLSLSDGGCINEGVVSYKLGVPGIPSISESSVVKRDIDILKYIKDAKYHLLHASVKESISAIRQAKNEGLKVTCEAAPHHFAINEEAVLVHGTNAKMNPPLRSEEDRVAIIEGLKDGTIDAIATDHAPHDQDSKNKSLQDAAFGIVGLETMLPISLELYHKGDLSLIDLLAKMTINPAKIINFNGGRIIRGGRADLTQINLKKEWIIDPEKFYCKSKNSPFKNRKVIGKAIRTVVNGVIVYQ